MKLAGSRCYNGEDVQYPKPEYGSDAQLFGIAHLQLSDKGYWQRQDSDIEYDVGYATQDIHGWIIRCWVAHCPIAPKRPDLEEGSKEERDHPAHDDCQHYFDSQRHSVRPEYPGVEIQDRHFHKSHSNYIPELEHEKYLQFLSIRTLSVRMDENL